MTLFIGVSSSALLGYKQYYRVTFDVTASLNTYSPYDTLSGIYDRMGDTGVITPLSPDPLTPGDSTMVVDCYTPFVEAGSVSVAEAVRRLEAVASNAGFLLSTHGAVRSIQKLSGIADVTQGATDRQTTTDDTNQQNDESNPLTILGNFLGGLGHFATLGVVAIAAYAILNLSAGLSLLPKLPRGRK